MMSTWLFMRFLMPVDAYLRFVLYQIGSFEYQPCEAVKEGEVILANVTFVLSCACVGHHVFDQI